MESVTTFILLLLLALLFAGYLNLAKIKAWWRRMWKPTAAELDSPEPPRRPYAPPLRNPRHPPDQP